MSDKLRTVQAAIEQAIDCIRGETPEDCTNEEARQDTLTKLREADELVAALAQPQNDAEVVAWRYRDTEGGIYGHFWDYIGVEPADYPGREIEPLFTAPPPELERMRKALEKIEYASRKDSLTDKERLQSIRTVVCAELSRAGDNHASDGKESEGSPVRDYSETSRSNCEPERGPSDTKSIYDVLGDQRVGVHLPIPSDDPGAPLERIRTEAARLGYALVPMAHTPTRIKNRIDSHLNAALCEMKPNHDDSISGFNDAWDIVRRLFDEARR